MELKPGTTLEDVLKQNASEQQQAIAREQAKQQKIIAQQEADLQAFRAQQQAQLEAQQQAQKQAQQQAQLKAQQEAQVLAQKQQTLAVQAKNEAHQQSTMDIASSLSIGLAIYLIYYFLIKKSSVNNIKNGAIASILKIYFLIGYAVAGISALSVFAYYFVGPGAFWNGSVGIMEGVVGLPIGLLTSALRIVSWPLGVIHIVAGQYSISEYLFYIWFSK
jgi:cation transport ATPase